VFRTNHGCLLFCDCRKPVDIPKRTFTPHRARRGQPDPVVMSVQGLLATGCRPYLWMGVSVSPANREKCHQSVATQAG
jgi:hypothetical protein